MTREQFEHAIRAAGAILEVSELLVIGSQAVHESAPLDLHVVQSPELRARLAEVPALDDAIRAAVAARIP